MNLDLSVFLKSQCQTYRSESHLLKSDIFSRNIWDYLKGIVELKEMNTGEEFLKTSTFREREIKKVAMVTEKNQRCERTTVMNLQCQISQGEKQ